MFKRSYIEADRQLAVYRPASEDEGSTGLNLFASVFPFGSDSLSFLYTLTLRDVYSIIAQHVAYTGSS